ncbi:hypothetical protein [Collimonas humicola]|uniref:hypothetical protein n=1 Tax=Collimonas humicola TaxID=2825886 RepID=UPI001B8CAC71|nr:hypothetical protein [Collimonas humicola]
MFANSLIISAGAASVLIALLHVYVILKGPVAYRQFGAGERLASMAERGSWLPALLTSGITITFLIFAYYYIAAGGWVPIPPFLQVGLLAIAALYTVRGVMIVPLLVGGRTLTRFEWGSSLLSLLIGLLHFAATSLYLQHSAALA